MQCVNTCCEEHDGTGCVHPACIYTRQGADIVVGAMRADLAQARERIAKLEDVKSAAKLLAETYKCLVDSGDCGFWKAEDDDSYAALTQALAALDTGDAPAPSEVPHG